LANFGVEPSRRRRLEKKEREQRLQDHKQKKERKKEKAELLGREWKKSGEGKWPDLGGSWAQDGKGEGRRRMEGILARPSLLASFPSLQFLRLDLSVDRSSRAAY